MTDFHCGDANNSGSGELDMQVAVRETMVDGALLEKDCVACLQTPLVEMLEGLLMHGGGLC